MKSRLLILITIFTILTAGIGYIIYSVLWMDKLAAREINAAPNSASTIKDMVLKGGTIYLQDKDINSLLELYTANLSNQGNIKIEVINCSITDDKISFYIYFKYKKLRLQLNTTGSLGYEEGTINYTPDYFKLGKLPLPEKFVLNKLKSYVPVNMEKERIEIDNKLIPFIIEGLILRDNKLEIKLKELLLKESKLDLNGAKADKPSESNSPIVTMEESLPVSIIEPGSSIYTTGSINTAASEDPNNSTYTTDSKALANSEGLYNSTNTSESKGSKDVIVPDSKAATIKGGSPINIKKPGIAAKGEQLDSKTQDPGKTPEQSTEKGTSENQIKEQIIEEMENLQQQIIREKEIIEEKEVIEEYPTNKVEPILIRINRRLETLYSKVKTTREKQFIAEIQNTLSKLLEDPAYSYETDVSKIMAKYDKLSISEQEDFENTVLENIDLTTLIEFIDYLWLWPVIE